MRYTLLLLLLLFPFISNAQVNLVPNPSFEDTNYCPNSSNRVDACKDWYNFGNSPDYFNSCNINPVAVPNNAFDFQYARTGQAMMGVLTYASSGGPFHLNYREFIGCQLQQPLNIGQEYFISFYANFANYPINGAILSTGLGLNFSTVPFDSCCHPPLTNNATIYTNLLISDTLNWTCIKGKFRADSTYKYIIIGSFFDDNHIDTINLYTIAHCCSYYFIDDVCVSEDSTLCYTQQLFLPDNIEISFFYDTNENKALVRSPWIIQRIIVYDILGQVIYAKNVSSYEHAIEMSRYATGIYFIRIETTSKSIIKKIFTF